MRKKLFILLIILGGIMIAFGLHGVRQKHMEAERNRQYEVSLIKALKNSYRDIEKIEISSPYYTEKPGIWSCDVVILFANQEEISYGVSHDLDKEVNYGGIMSGKTDDYINKQWEKLHRHKGETTMEVEVSYSNGEKGIQ